MEYESYKQQLETLSSGISKALHDWLTLSGGVLGTLSAACSREAVDIQGLQDAKASFAAESSFLKGLPDRVEEYRKAVKGLRQFYEPARAPAPVPFAAEEATKSGWLFGIKKSPAPMQIEHPAPAADLHRDQRAFIDAKTLLADLDKSLDNIRENIIRVSEETDELAYGYKAEVVRLNADIRAAGPDIRKKEARRFFLEDAVGALSERSTQLGLHARVIGRLHSSEYVENPFDD